MILVLAAEIEVVLRMVGIRIVIRITTAVNLIINVTVTPVAAEVLAVALIAENPVTFPESVQIRKKNKVEEAVAVVDEVDLAQEEAVAALNVVKKVTFRENVLIMGVVVAVVEIVIALVEEIVAVLLVEVVVVEEVVVALTVVKKVTFPESVLMLEEVEVEIVAVLLVEVTEKGVLLVVSRVIFQESVQKLEETEGIRDEHVLIYKFPVIKVESGMCCFLLCVGL